METNSSEQLIIFVKAPRLGTVKTRLAEQLGAAEAAAAYRLLVEVLLNGLAGIEQVQLRFTPDDAAPEVNGWLRGPGWSLAPQGPGDLGQRLRHLFDQSFSRGARRVVVIGSDCPWVTAEDISAAWRALRDHDVALGPAADGGYWLIGLRASQPDLFDGIHWSESTVCEQTLDRIRAKNLRAHLLRTLRDVDSVEDWKFFLKQAGR